MYLFYQRPFCSLDGLASFQSFLKSEFSEENLEFWIACEDFKKTRSPDKIAEKAKKIYEEFIRTEAPKEVGPEGLAGGHGPGRCGGQQPPPGRTHLCLEVRHTCRVQRQGSVAKQV